LRFRSPYCESRSLDGPPLREALVTCPHSHVVTQIGFKISRTPSSRLLKIRLSLLFGQAPSVRFPGDALCSIGWSQGENRKRPVIPCLFPPRSSSSQVLLPSSPPPSVCSTAAPCLRLLLQARQAAEVPPVWRPLYIGGVGEFLMVSTGRRDLTCENILATH
jgi:hypothetical protein